MTNYLPQGQRKASYTQVTNLVYDRKFDVALRASSCEAFMRRSREARLTEDDKLLLTSPGIPPVDELRVKATVYIDILRKVFQDSESGRIYSRDNKIPFDRIMEIAHESIRVQRDYMNSNHQNTATEHANRLFTKWKHQQEIPYHLRNIMAVADSMDCLVRELGHINDPSFRKLGTGLARTERQKHNSWSLKEVGVRIVWSNRMAILEYGNDCFLVPRPYLLMIHNKLHDLVSIFVYTLGVAGCSMEKSSTEILVTFLEEMFLLAKEYQDDCFKIFKCLESMVIAEHLLNTDTWRNDSFLKALNSDLLETLDFDYRSSDLRRILRGSSPQLRNELGCLSKILGHPFVLMAQGSESLREKTNEQHSVDLLKVNTCMCYIIQNYVSNHVLKHKKWPPSEIPSPTAPVALRMAKAMGLDPNSKVIVNKYGPTTIKDYNFVQLLPAMRFSKLENYMTALKDKTISLLRTKVMSNYIAADRDDAKTSWRETRLLLVYLLQPDIVHRHMDYIDDYNDSTDLEDLLDYLVIRIVPKEKELKEDFRGFGCKTYEERARSLAQETAAMSYLDLYSDEQAMTLGELPLARKLYALRTIISAYSGYRCLFINLDASSWNNKFRSATVDEPMSQTLDKVFNTKIFQKTHLAFEKSLIVVPDEEETYWWDGQAGGIEGLNQDTWVVAYLGQIKTALEPLGFRYHVLCKGDDVRILVFISPTLQQAQSMEDIRRSLITAISTTMKDFGHKIKVHDSYGSEAFLSFSKSASIGTIELPQVYRKIQKAHGANNAFIITLDEYIAATFSNAHSACRVGVGAIAVYQVALFWTLYYLLRHPTYQRLTDTELLGMCLTPSIVGGFPIIYLHNMYVRAESDLLSPFLGLVLHVRTSYLDLYEVFSRFLTFTIPEKPDYVSLFLDPYSLPIHRPQLPTTVLRKSITPALRRMTKNEMIRELFERLDEEESSVFVEAMVSSNVLVPRILSNLYAATPQGLLNEILRKFESSRSVYELLILRGGRRLAQAVLFRTLRAEKQLQSWRYHKLKGLEYGITEDSPTVTIDRRLCPTENAQMLREKLWKKPIEGISMPPMQHMITILSPLEAAGNEHAEMNKFIYYIKPLADTLQGPHMCQHYSTSSLKPFLGYTTRTGTVEPQVHFIDQNQITLKVKNLLDLISWTSKTGATQEGEAVSSNLHVLITSLIGLYTEQSLESLAPFAGKHKSGTGTHHIRSPQFVESIVPNTLSNVYQQALGITNSHTTLRKSSDHYYVNFLHILCYTISQIFQTLEFSPFRFGSPEVWAVTSDCPYCSRPIHETPIVIDTRKIQRMSVKPLQMTQLGQITERWLFESVTAFKDAGIKAVPTTEELTYEHAVAGVLQEFIDQTYTLRTGLQDKYHQAAMSSELKSKLAAIAPPSSHRDISLSELKALTSDMFVQYLCPKIHLEIIAHFPGVSEETVGVYLSGVIGTEFPWYEIIAQLCKANHLGSLILALARLSGVNPPNCFSNPARASQYVGIASFVIQETSPRMPKFVVLSHYTFEDMTRHLRCLATASVKRTAKKVLVPLVKLLMSPEHDPTLEEITELAAGMCLLTIDFNNPIVVQALTENLAHMSEGVVQLITSEMINPLWENYHTYHDALRDLEGSDFYHFQMRYRRAPWELAFDHLIDLAEGVFGHIERTLRDSRVALVHTELHTCIGIIRSHRRGLNDGDDPEGVEEPDEVLLDERARVVVVDAPFRPLKSVRSGANILRLRASDTELPSGLFTPALYSMTTAKIMLSPVYIHRPFGSMTTSCNKLIDIFLRHQYQNPNRVPIYAATFGEGYGGILQMLCTMFCDSTFVYNTLPPEVELEAHPYIALESAAQNRNTIIREHLDRGLTDLSALHVIKQYERYKFRYNLITCDAECGESYNSPERKALVLNVARFYLRNRDADGILILKLMVKESNNIHFAVGILQAYCANLYLHRSMASQPGEIYLVAWGLVKATVPNYTDVPTLPSRQNYEMIEAFRKRLHERFQELIQGDHRDINIQEVYSLSSPMTFAMFDHLSGTGKAMSQLHLILSRRDMDKMLNADSLHDYLEPLVDLGNLAVRKLALIRDDETNVEHHREHWDHDTRNHRMHRAYQYLKLRGFLSVCHPFMQNPGCIIISEASLRLDYRECLREFSRRYKFHPVTSAHFTTGLTDYGYHYHPYRAFFEGAKIGVYCIAGYVH